MPRKNRVQLQTILVLLLLGISVRVFAQDTESYAEDEVIVEINPLQYDEETGQYSLPPYAERKLPWGITFGIFYRELLPVDYLSVHDQVNYSVIFGEKSIPMIEGQFGLQRNLSFGSLAIEIAVGTGQIEDDLRRLSLSSIKLAGAWYVNNLFSDPYLVPFGRVGVHRLNYEDNLEGSPAISDALAPALFFSGGVLIQMDWIEPRTATRAYLDYGLENAYLSVELTQYQSTSDEEAPNFASGPNLGAGIMLEF